MNQLINLDYRSVFKYPNDQESFRYHGKAYLKKSNDQIVISYVDQNKIKIVLKENEILLYNGNSLLRLCRNLTVDNRYQTEYGALNLKTKLLAYENSKNIKIKYALYDGNFLVSEVYILIKYQVLEN